MAIYFPKTIEIRRRRYDFEIENQPQIITTMEIINISEMGDVSLVSKTCELIFKIEKASFLVSELSSEEGANLEFLIWTGHIQKGEIKEVLLEKLKIELELNKQDLEKIKEVRPAIYAKAIIAMDFKTVQQSSTNEP